MNFASLRLSDILKGNRHGRISAQFGMLMGYLNTGCLPAGVTGEDLLARYLQSKERDSGNRVIAQILEGSASAAQAATELANLLGVDDRVVDGAGQPTIEGQNRRRRLEGLIRILAHRAAAAKFDEAAACRAKADGLLRLATSP